MKPTVYKQIEKSVQSGSELGDLPDPEMMSLAELHAEVLGGREAFEVVVHDLRETRKRLEQALRNAAEWRGMYDRLRSERAR